MKRKIVLAFAMTLAIGGTCMALSTKPASANAISLADHPIIEVVDYDGSGAMEIADDTESDPVNKLPEEKKSEEKKDDSKKKDDSFGKKETYSYYRVRNTSSQKTSASGDAVKETDESGSSSSSGQKYAQAGRTLTRSAGVFYGPSGKETYYNLDMSGVVRIMRRIGVNKTYWVRQDGVKMYGDYVMVAANLNLRPRGSVVQTSLGPGMVCDTGSFARRNPTQLDIATSW